MVNERGDINMNIVNDYKDDLNLYIMNELIIN